MLEPCDIFHMTFFREKI